MITAYLAAMRRYADFSGRTSRGGFWWFQACFVLLLMAALCVDAMVVADPENAGAPVTALVLMAHILPGLAIAVRRLHDTDRSGWFYLFAAVPLVGPLVLFVWDCQPGTPRTNRFGPDPLAEPVDILARSGHALAAAARDVVSDIERLAGLKASGTLTDGEFQALKAQVVAGEARA